MRSTREASIMASIDPFQSISMDETDSAIAENGLNNQFDWLRNSSLAQSQRVPAEYRSRNSLAPSPGGAMIGNVPGNVMASTDRYENIRSGLPTTAVNTNLYYGMNRSGTNVDIPVNQLSANTQSLNARTLEHQSNMFSTLPANISTPLDAQQESFTSSNLYPTVSNNQMTGVEMNNPQSFLRYSSSGNRNRMIIQDSSQSTSNNTNVLWPLNQNSWMSSNANWRSENNPTIGVVMPGNSSHHLNDPNNRWQPLEHDSSSRPMLSDTNPLLLPSRNYQNPSSFNQSSIVPNNHGPWCTPGNCNCSIRNGSVNNMAINLGPHSTTPQNNFIGSSYICPARNTNSMNRGVSRQLMPMGTSGVSFTVNPHNNLQQSTNNNGQSNFFTSHAPPESLNHLHQTNNVWAFNQVQNALISQQQQNFANNRNLNYATLGSNPNFQTPSSNPGRFSQNNSFAGFRNNAREVYRNHARYVPGPNNNGFNSYVGSGNPRSYVGSTNGLPDQHAGRNHAYQAQHPLLIPQRQFHQSITIPANHLLISIINPSNMRVQVSRQHLGLGVNPNGPLGDRLSPRDYASDSFDEMQYEQLLSLAERLGDVKQQGLTKSQIDKLESYYYSSDTEEEKMSIDSQEKPNEKKEDETKKMCVICISEWKNNQHIRKLPCKHEFHSKCIDKWLKQKRSCPICRGEVSCGENDQAPSASSSHLHLQRATSFFPHFPDVFMN